MARIRTIKPEFWTHEDLSALPEATHMLAAALLNHADDEGYFNANPGLVKAACCPLREPSVSIHDSLKSLENVGYIQVFDGKDGKRYGRVLTFDDHQRVNRPTPSKIKPLCVVRDGSQTAHPQLTEDSPPERNREQGTRKGKEQSNPSSTDKPSTPPLPPPAEIADVRARRLAEVTDDAKAAFNAILAKPVGLLPAVHAKVGVEKHRDMVKRCLRTAVRISEEQYGTTVVARPFWEAYFRECARDDFKSGRQPPGKGHENWTPSFEYLTREIVMIEVFDKVMADQGEGDNHAPGRAA